MTIFEIVDAGFQIKHSAPGKIFYGEKSVIEAITGLTGVRYAIGYTTDIETDGEFGYYDGVSAWHWGGTGGPGGGGTWGTITGELQDQEDLSLILNRIEVKQKNDYSRIKKSSASIKVFSNSNFI